MPRIARVTGGLLALALLAACTSSPARSGFRPTFETEPCPQDLEFLLIPTHACGYLTVLEDRSRPAGSTIQLFVVRIEPQAGSPEGGPAMVVPGTDLAVENDFYGIANLAERVHREVFLMDQRGTGRSRPSLDCPEIDALSETALREGIGETRSRTAFLEAVSSCRARLTGDGIDVAAYGLRAVAQDGVDLRHALGIETWGIATYGTASLIAFEMLREDPAHVDLMVLDSPEYPQVDPRAMDVAGTRGAIEAVVADCERSERCAGAYPDLPASLEDAAARLDDHPLTVDARTASGARFEVRVDGSALLRALRTLLRFQTDELVASVPAAIDRALDGDVASLVAPTLAYAPAFCAGYLPTCDEAHAVAEGTYLTVMCQAWAGTGSATDAVAGEAAYADTFETDPWVEACTRWMVPDADPSVWQPVRSDVPTLIALGRYDPYTSVEIAMRAAETLSRHWVVVNPSGGHNALSQTCMIQIRNAWVGDPLSPPDLECLASIPPKRFVIDRS